jgi:hypothetical protein
MQKVVSEITVFAEMGRRQKCWKDAQQGTTKTWIPLDVRIERFSRKVSIICWKRARI